MKKRAISLSTSRKARFGKLFALISCIILCVTSDSYAHGPNAQSVVFFGTIFLAPIIIPALTFILNQFCKVKHPVRVAGACHLFAGYWLLEAANMAPRGLLWEDAFRYFILVDILLPCLFFSAIAYLLSRLLKSPETFLLKILCGMISPLGCLWVYTRLFNYKEEILYQPVALIAVYIGILLGPVCFFVFQKLPAIKNRLVLFAATGLLSLAISQISFPYFGSVLLSKDLMHYNPHFIAATSKIQGFSRNPLSTHLLIASLETDSAYTGAPVKEALRKTGPFSVPALMECLNNPSQMNWWNSVWEKMGSLGAFLEGEGLHKLNQWDSFLYHQKYQRESEMTRINNIRRYRYRDAGMYVVQVRIHNCRNALEAITGNNFGVDNSAWIKWWDSSQGKPVNTVQQEIP